MASDLATDATTCTHIHLYISICVEFCFNSNRPIIPSDCADVVFGYHIIEHFMALFVGTFLLTELLLDLLKASPSARIVNTSASASNLGKINFDDINMKQDYTPGQAFAQSKLAVDLYTLKLAERLKGNLGLNPCICSATCTNQTLNNLNIFLEPLIACCKYGIGQIQIE